MISDPDSSDAALRRAVSTAYYALFHVLADAVAGRFAGHRPSSAAYSLVYRALDHARIRNVLRETNRPRLNEAYRKILMRDAASVELRRFADGFLRLQALRHSADYDPGIDLSRADVGDLIAEAAIATFHSIEDAELADVLTLMLVGWRTQ